MIYPSIRIEGAILSPDILEKLEDIAGQRPVDFGLEPSIKVKEEIARAWADAQDYWRIFNRKLETLKKESPATTETRNLWVVPLLGLLGYQLEFEAKSIELNAKLYPISHRIRNRGDAAIHIIGSNEPAGLDRKSEKAALRMSAHAMLQEYLNLTEQLYGIVTNGRVLRLLRDSSRLVKLTYLEFDLDRIFTDGLFADFAVLYRLLHVTRLPQTIETSATSLLEGYHQETIEQGSRIRDGLRLAVKEALKTLGTGFLAHPDNHELRQQVASGELRPDIYFNQLLRLIYRLLFLMVIEERGMVFPKGTATKKSTIYVQHYSIERLRRQARNRSLQVTCYSDGWLQLLSTFHLFEDRDGAAALGTTLLGGQLFSPANLGLLPFCTLSNKALYSTLEQLCFFTLPENSQRMPVNFGALATEEFGSVYESLLELHPFTDLLPTPFFGFRKAAGNERKTTGSYYTHAALVESLLQSALDPLLDEAEKSATPEKSILALKVCDPACGSGHFLIAAAQRIARRLARLRSGDEEPSPELLHHTLREVIGHCIFGVDINPMAAELCRVGLWLEAMEPGKPLSYLEHHIRVGNSLIGTTPELIAAGLPNEAFKPIEGDNKEACAVLKKWNRGSREGLGPLFAQQDEQQQQHLQATALAIEEMPDDDLQSILDKKIARFHLENEEEYRIKKMVADAWCAAFVIEKSFSEPGIERTAFGITQSLLLHILNQNLTREHQNIVDEVKKLAESYQFFHWHLAYPEVYARGGFDVILGNPPWERVKLQEKEWFAERCEAIAMASNASARKRLIRELNATNPALQDEFLASLRKAEGESHFLRNSGRFPLCGRGDINLYTVFAELMRSQLNQHGRMGAVLPSGIASDDTTKFFFQDLIEKQSLVSLFDFENKKAIFPNVHRSYKFCLFTAGGGETPTAREAVFVFFAHDVDDLKNPDRQITLSPADILLLNPNTRTCPIFRSRADAELTKAIYRRVPVLIKEYPPEQNPWGIRFSTMFHMSNDSNLFRTREQLLVDGWHLKGNIFHKDGEVYLPLYEAKLIHHFDHRWATYDHNDDTHDVTLAEKQQSDFFVMPRYWVPEQDVFSRLEERWDRQWLMGFRDITNTTNERTAIFSVMPPHGVGHTCPIVLSDRQSRELGMLLLNLSTFALDFSARQKIGGTHLTYGYLNQLPLLDPDAYSRPVLWDKLQPEMGNWLLPRLLELTCTAWDLEHFAQDYGWSGPPFRWDDERRFMLRCELDAAFFNLYLTADKHGEWIRAEKSAGAVQDESSKELIELKRYFPTPRQAVEHVMDSFPIVKRKDEAEHGLYRTKEVILEIYDAMAEAIRTGIPYQTKLNPPPADPSCCHPPKPKERM